MSASFAFAWLASNLGSRGSRGGATIACVLAIAAVFVTVGVLLLISKLWRTRCPRCGARGAKFVMDDQGREMLTCDQCQYRSPTGVVGGN
jgi:hypothetical protein